MPPRVTHRSLDTHLLLRDTKAMLRGARHTQQRQLQHLLTQGSRHQHMQLRSRPMQHLDNTALLRRPTHHSLRHHLISKASRHSQAMRSRHQAMPHKRKPIHHSSLLHSRRDMRRLPHRHTQTTAWVSQAWCSQERLRFHHPVRMAMRHHLPESSLMVPTLPTCPQLRAFSHILLLQWPGIMQHLGRPYWTRCCLGDSPCHTDTRCRVQRPLLPHTKQHLLPVPPLLRKLLLQRLQPPTVPSTTSRWMSSRRCSSRMSLVWFHRAQ
mmetsp:Transcript_133563/g.249776  ORF Transcript_133563/g.249776 Transcript_133563/m.249776 type:complete len:266 (+) Transcript_133563:1399-2196(+)